MNIEELRAYCLSRKMITEEFPFGPDTLVYKIGGKVFALIGLDNMDLRINLKCDPERSLDLRERHPAVIPGFHMNKKHWNTIVVDALMDDNLVFQLIDHSYDLVFQSLPGSVRKNLVIPG